MRSFKTSNWLIFRLLPIMKFIMQYKLQVRYSKINSWFRYLINMDTINYRFYVHRCFYLQTNWSHSGFNGQLNQIWDVNFKTITLAKTIFSADTNLMKDVWNRPSFQQMTPYGNPNKLLLCNLFYRLKRTSPFLIR